MIEHFPALIPNTTPAAHMQSFHANVLSAPGGSVFVPEVSVYEENRIFNYRLSYAKGAAVIHNLRFEMQNDNLFYQSLKNYQQKFKDSVATTDDFKQVAEVTSGKNLGDFFNQWIYGEGYPTFNITFLKEGSGTLVLKVNQTASMPSVTPFFKGLYEFKIISTQGDTTVKINLTSNNQEFRFNYFKSPSNVIVDPENWVINNTGSITNGGFIIPPIPPPQTVPPSVVTLKGTSDTCFVNLSWLTINEHDLSRYEIESSSDNITFKKEGEKYPLNSNSNQFFSFNYRPVANPVMLYVRLKIVESNGSVRYSNTITVTLNCVYLFNVKTGPNPARDYFNVYIISPLDEEATITFTDMAGRVLFKKEVLIIMGDNKISLNNISVFPTGAYILRIKTNGNIITRKIIKM
ncbi:MAG: T9SS type A sorting domain-containing protein, partial [Ferruginibacter sp.]